MRVTVRWFEDADAEATARIYFDAVRIGAQGHYNEVQRRAWASSVPDTPPWRARLKSQASFVAERDGAVIGFMTLKPDGCIDLAFVAPEVMGTGVARQLYERLLAETASMGLRRLHTEASHLARPFFERQGWSVVKQQTVERDGVALTNSVMEKHLTPKQTPDGGAQREKGPQ
ncbi:MAG: GNAT family N-acetyltransferase [Pseudomonadota bacterium]